jgi:hypothetical protein
MPAGGLSALGDIQLSSARQKVLESARLACAGHAVWQNRKVVEAYDLLALEQISNRFRVEFLDIQESLRTLVRMRVPTPCLPDPESNLLLAPEICLGITYPEEALRSPMPGFAFVEIMHPRHVWHANVSAEGAQMLCLGARLPAGIQLKEIMLMTHGAISMQTVMIDELDAAGVLNPDAARWWQQNIHRLPLSREAFIENTTSVS